MGVVAGQAEPEGGGEGLDKDAEHHVEVDVEVEVDRAQVRLQDWGMALPASSGLLLEDRRIIVLGPGPAGR